MKKETKAEREARRERMRTAPVRMRELVDETNRRRAERAKREPQA